MFVSPIAILAKSTLDEREIELADHLAELLADDKYNTFAYLLPILPKYRELEDRIRSLESLLARLAAEKGLQYRELEQGVLSQGQSRS